MKFITQLSLSFVALCSAITAAEKPNILFIFADDHAFDCLHAHGNSEVKTPHLDRLNARGTRFSHAYNSGAWQGAICVASRTMMMTGQQVWDAKAAPLKSLQSDKLLMPQRISEAGYTTYFAGKWHVPLKAEQTFDVTKNIRPGMPRPVDKAQYQRDYTKQDTGWSPTDRSQGGFWAGGKHWSEVLADDGVALLDQASKQKQPFFMMLCFNAPHDPRQAPQEFLDLYPYDSIEVPSNFLPEYPHQIGSNKVRDELLAPFPRSPRSIQVNRAEYYALITHMDAQIGKILDALDASGKADNTIIIFTADHGLSVGQHGLLGKQNLYDHSVRVPWIIAGPGIPKGKTVDAPIYLQSAIATSIDLAGAKSEGIAFDSVLPILEGKSQGLRSVYGAYMMTQRMVTKGKFKLIRYPKINVELLFDLSKDPKEQHDLSKKPEHAATLTDLRGELERLMREMDDPLKQP